MQNNSENPFACKLSPEILANREFKSSLFTFLFTKDKRNALSLYNAVKGTNYTNTEDLKFEILDGALFIGMRNDVSFLFAKSLSLYEHQSTYNPNMPLRGFFYFADLYRQLLTEPAVLYGHHLVKIPTPHYIVLYNGPEKDFSDASTVLRLSDAFFDAPEPGLYEWSATMININLGSNDDLLDKCAMLKEYSTFIDLVKRYRGTMSLETAVERAVSECIAAGILSDLLSKNRREVFDLILTEFDEEQYKKVLKQEFYEDGFEDGFKDGIAQGITDGSRNTILQLTKRLLLKGQDDAFIKETLGVTDEDIRVAKQDLDC